MSTAECTEVIGLDYPLGRPKLPTAVDPEGLIEMIARRIAIPLAEGAYKPALFQLNSIYKDLHGCHARDPLDDHISVWIQDVRLVGILEGSGIISMLDLMERPPVWYLSLHMISESHMRVIAEAQRKFREALQEQDVPNNTC